MIVLLLLTVFFRLTLQEDQCNLCAVPEILSNADEATCGRVPNDTNSRMIMIRSWDRVSSACYLQVVGCPAYDLVLSSQCSSLYHNLEGMQCVSGKFLDPITRLPIDKIRCNPSAPPPTPPDPCDLCVDQTPTILSPTDTSSPCGEPLTNTTAVPQLSLMSDGTTCTLYTYGCGLYEVVMDGTGCAVGANPYATCQNGVWQADGRRVDKIRCGTADIPSPSCIPCPPFTPSFEPLAPMYAGFGYASNPVQVQQGVDSNGCTNLTLTCTAPTFHTIRLYGPYTFGVSHLDDQGNMFDCGSTTLTLNDIESPFKCVNGEWLDYSLSPPVPATALGCAYLPDKICHPDDKPHVCESCLLPSILSQQNDTTVCGPGPAPSSPDPNITVIWNDSKQLCELSVTGCSSGLFEAVFGATDCYVLVDRLTCDPASVGRYMKEGVGVPLTSVRCS